jgi:glyoxylase-like metal-dependent hydrolase (beta-lactamase superfamily II)
MGASGKGLPQGVRLVTAGNAGPLTGAGTNSWILGQGRVAFVDPGPMLPEHQAALLAALELGETVEAILITHPHADHAALAPVLAAATGAGILPLKDGARILGSWGELKALYTPGHHPDHFCLIGPGWALTGDHVMGWSSTLVAPPEGHMGQYMVSLDRLEAESAPIGLPGHGPVIEDLPQRLRALRRHRQMREAAVLAAVGQGALGLEAITRAVYGPLAAELVRPAMSNCLAHLIDLSDRNLVRADRPADPDAIFAPM